MRFCVYLEDAISGFERYHRYTLEPILETVLRRFYLSYIRQIYPRELKAFRSFDRFENASKLAVDVARRVRA